MSVSEPGFIKRLEDEEKNRRGVSKALTHDLAQLTGNLREGNGAIDRTFNEIFDILKTIPGIDVGRIEQAKGNWETFASIDPPGCDGV